MAGTEDQGINAPVNRCGFVFDTARLLLGFLFSFRRSSFFDFGRTAFAE